MNRWILCVRSGSDHDIPFRENRFKPLTVNRAVGMGGTIIKSGPSKSNQTSIIAYRFSNRAFNLDHRFWIPRPQSCFGSLKG
jgi:hypothetical protein